MSRTFRRVSHHRGCENFGPMHVVITETLTAVGDGVRVDMHALGTQEGARVDLARSLVDPGVTLERAGASRIRLGYVEVLAVAEVA